MKECPSCKTKNRSDAHFCAECGADLKDVPAADNELAAAAGSLLGKAKEAAASGAKKAKETAGAFTGGQDFAVNPPVSSSVDGAPQKRRSVLVDPSERIISTIGSSYLQNYLSGDGVRKGIGVLTQKRFYYKGKNFAVNGRQMVSTTEEGVVSIEDITFTMFTYVRHIGLLIFSVLLHTPDQQLHLHGILAPPCRKGAPLHESKERDLYNWRSTGNCDYINWRSHHAKLSGDLETG